jgi:hypothetical protein
MQLIGLRVVGFDRRLLGSELGKRVLGGSDDGAAAGAGGQDSVGSPLRRSKRTLSGSEV